MSNSLLIILGITAGATLVFTVVSILLLLFFSENKATVEESNYQKLLKKKIRNRKSANKAAKAYLHLQEEYSDLKIINDRDERKVKKAPIAKIEVRKRQFTIKPREKVAV